MVYSSPAWVPNLSLDDIPDSVTLAQFTLDGDSSSRNDVTRALLVDGISGKSYSRKTLHQRVEWLAAALAKDLGWSIINDASPSSPWDRVVAICSLNTVGFLVSLGVATGFR